MLLLSYRNTQRLPDTAASTNTTAVTETTPSFFAWTFILQYATISTSWQTCWGVFEWDVFGGHGRVLTFIKNLFGFETLWISSMHGRLVAFTFMHLADAFIQSDLQCIQAIHFLSVCVFPGNRTHNLCAADAMLYHWATGTHQRESKTWNLIIWPI